MSTIGISAAAGPIMMAWVERGLTDNARLNGDFESVLESLKETGHSSAGFGQVVAAFILRSESMDATDVRVLISQVARSFDSCQAK